MIGIDYYALQRAREQSAAPREEIPAKPTDRHRVPPVRTRTVSITRANHRANGTKPDPSQPWGQELERIRVERERLTHLGRALDLRIADAIKEATRAGASDAQIGSLLGVSKQRVGQLQVTINRRIASERARRGQETLRQMRSTTNLNSTTNRST